jgi:putative membrane protein
MTDKARSAGESIKGSAKDTGAAVKDSATGAAGYVSDTAKNATSRLAGKDSLFVRKAAIGGLAEVKSAELAKDKASSTEVKSFADVMIRDHSKANQELQELAKQKGITVPTALDHEHQGNLDKLTGLTGAAFDKEYVRQQQAGHEKMLQLMTDEAANGKDPDLKTFAAAAKTVVSEHRAHSKELAR